MCHARTVKSVLNLYRNVAVKNAMYISCWYLYEERGPSVNPKPSSRLPPQSQSIQTPFPEGMPSSCFLRTILQKLLLRLTLMFDYNDSFLKCFRDCFCQSQLQIHWFRKFNSLHWEYWGRFNRTYRLLPKLSWIRSRYCFSVNLYKSFPTAKCTLRRNSWNHCTQLFYLKPLNPCISYSPFRPLFPSSIIRFPTA